MKKAPFALAAVGALVLSTSAFAAGEDFSAADADASGELSFDEAIVVHPDWSEDQFAQLDADASGGLNEEEYVEAEGAMSGSMSGDSSSGQSSLSGDGSTDQSGLAGDGSTDQSGLAGDDSSGLSGDSSSGMGGDSSSGGSSGGTGSSG